MNKQLRNNLSAFFALIAVVGLVGFLYNVTGGTITFGGSKEFPLIDANGIAVDSHGNIYCGIQFYSRIQKYNPNGQFLTSWYIHTGGGKFSFSIDNNDNVMVTTVRLNSIITYDSNGKLLKELFFNNYSSSSFEANNECNDKEYNTYVIERQFFSPIIVKYTPDNKRIVLVEQPLYIAFCNGPIFWFYGALGFIGLLFLNRSILENIIRANK